MLVIENPPKPMLTVDDVARRLNANRRTVIRWINEGRVPGTKIGQAFRIDPDEFEAWYTHTFRGGNVNTPRRTQTDQ